MAGLVVADGPEDLMGACVADWWAARATGEVAMYAATREQVWRLNALARARMAEAGRLGGPEVVVPTVRRGDYALPERTFAAGDEVLLAKNRRNISGDVAVRLADRTRRYQGVKNGQRARVVGVDQETGRLSVAHQDGRVLTLAADYVRDYLAHGYAITAHKAQGDTVGQAARAAALGIVEEVDRRQGRAFVYGLADAELGLVMASRATDSTRFYVQSLAEPDLYDEGSRRRPIDPARALAASWGRSGAEGMASDELERQRVIKRLAAGCSPQDLAAQRQLLVSLGRGDQDPAAAVEVARAELATAVARVETTRRGLAEAILDVEDAREAPASSEASPQAPPPGDAGREDTTQAVAPAPSLVVEAEARAEAALMATRAAEAALHDVQATQERRAGLRRQRKLPSAPTAATSSAT